MLTVLGAQMARVPVAKSEIGEASGGKAFLAGMAMRMLISPILAFIALKILGVSGMLFSVLLILASMPVAVNAVILAEKFDAAPKVVSRCILWTTLSSFIVLPVLIALL
jgi:predicted permease